MIFTGRTLSSPAAERSEGTKTLRVFAVRCSVLCTPGMGVSLWGVSPLYVNPVNGLITLAKVLAEGKGVPVREGLKEAGVQIHEPTDRNSIQGPVSG